jgi:predicted transcriptional regulator
MSKNCRQLEAPDNQPILISIKPRYAEEILSGTKTVELRRRFSRNAPLPTRALIYASGSVGGLVGIMNIVEVVNSTPQSVWKRFGTKARVAREEYFAYFEGVDQAFALNIRMLAKFTRIISREEMLETFSIHPPQSYRFISQAVVDWAVDANR